MTLKPARLFVLSVPWAFLSSILLAQTSSFVVSSPRTTAQILISEKESELVHMAATLFSDDVYNVSGRSVALKSVAEAPYVIAVGTLGVHADFDAACKRTGIDLDKLASAWETFVIKSLP